MYVSYAMLPVLGTLRSEGAIWHGSYMTVIREELLCNESVWLVPGTCVKE